MNVIAALVIEKIVEFLLDKDNLEKFLVKLLGYVSNADNVPGLPEAIEKLKNETSEENLEELGATLESTGAMEPDRFAALVINETTVKV